MKNSSLTTVILVFLMTTIMLAFSLVLFSQSLPPQPPDPMEMARMQTDMMEKKLDLTLAQLMNVSEINEKYAYKIAEIFEGRESSQEDVFDKIKETEEQKDQELMRVLTNDQYEKWLALKKEMRPGRRE